MPLHCLIAPVLRPIPVYHHRLPIGACRLNAWANMNTPLVTVQENNPSAPDTHILNTYKRLSRAQSNYCHHLRTRNHRSLRRRRRRLAWRRVPRGRRRPLPRPRPPCVIVVLPLMRRALPLALLQLRVLHQQPHLHARPCRDHPPHRSAAHSMQQGGPA